MVSSTITEDEYTIIQEKAYQMLRQATSGYRGQTMTMYDTVDYYIMLATREYFSGS